MCESANVNFATEKATVVYDPQATEGKCLVDVIREAGYEVPSAKTALPITGMTCASCVATVERTLRRLPGVVCANVNFATEKAAVVYLPEQVSPAEMARAVREAGYDVVEEAGPAEKNAGIGSRAIGAAERNQRPEAQIHRQPSRRHCHHDRQA